MYLQLPAKRKLVEVEIEVEVAPARRPPMCVWSIIHPPGAASVWVGAWGGRQSTSVQHVPSQWIPPDPTCEVNENPTHKSAIKCN